MTAQFLTVLKALGSEWQKAGKHRIYFNDLAQWFGLEFETYNSGNISGAWLDGDEISNRRAQEFSTYFRSAKVYYDVPGAAFYGQNIDSAYLKKIVARIKAAVEGRIDEMDEQEMCR